MTLLERVDLLLHGRLESLEFAGMLLAQLRKLGLSLRVRLGRLARPLGPGSLDRLGMTSLELCERRGVLFLSCFERSSRFGTRLLQFALRNAHRGLMRLLQARQLVLLAGGNRLELFLQRSERGRVLGLLRCEGRVGVGLSGREGLGVRGSMSFELQGVRVAQLSQGRLVRGVGVCELGDMVAVARRYASQFVLRQSP